MSQQVEFGTPVEIKIWEARRPRRGRLQREARTTYVRIGGEVFLAQGRVTSSDECLVSLIHVLTNKHFFGGSYGALTYAIKQGRVKTLNEMEVLAWTAK